jgi:hypothetical protein
VDEKSQVIQLPGYLLPECIRGCTPHVVGDHVGDGHPVEASEALQSVLWIYAASRFLRTDAWST